jgi:radical SAM superfamily enzyme YgiQ (UPF0313 family)
VLNCKKLGIRMHGTFMIGMPIETQETIEETIRFAEQSTANDWITASEP